MVSYKTCDPHFSKTNLAPCLHLPSSRSFFDGQGNVLLGTWWYCAWIPMWIPKSLELQAHLPKDSPSSRSFSSPFIQIWISDRFPVSPNFAEFRLLLPEKLPPSTMAPTKARRYGTAKNASKIIEENESLLWGIGNIGSLRVCRDLFHDVGSESIHGNLWGNWTCSPQFHHFHGFFLGQHMSYNSFHGWSGSFCPPIWPFTTPRNPKGCLFRTYLKPPTSGKFIDCKTTLSCNQNFFVISAWIPKYSYKDLL